MCFVSSYLLSHFMVIFFYISNGKCSMGCTKIFSMHIGFKFNRNIRTDMAFEAGFRNFDQISHFVVQSKIFVLFLFLPFQLENQNIWISSYKAINYSSARHLVVEMIKNSCSLLYACGYFHGSFDHWNYFYENSLQK